MMRKRILRIAALSSLLATAFAAGVYAEDILKRVDAYLRPDYNLVLDGKPTKLERDILIYEGSSYLPLKELGNLLGASILFKGDTKTIYVNSRLYQEQPIPTSDTNYEEIVMSGPYAAWYTYLGADYPVLITYNEKVVSGGARTYWRVADVKRMGIDLRGVPFVKEKYTEELFVSEVELRKIWRQAPVQATRQSGNYVITGEVNAKKIEAIQNHIKNSLNLRTNNREVTFNNKPIIVDATSEENYYDYLYYSNAYYSKGITTGNRLFRARLWLRKDSPEETYTVNTASSTDLYERANQREVDKTLGNTEPTSSP